MTCYFCVAQLLTKIDLHNLFFLYDFLHLLKCQSEKAFEKLVMLETEFAVEELLVFNGVIE